MNVTTVSTCSAALVAKLIVLLVQRGAISETEAQQIITEVASLQPDNLELMMRLFPGLSAT